MGPKSHEILTDLHFTGALMSLRADLISGFLSHRRFFLLILFFSLWLHSSPLLTVRRTFVFLLISFFFGLLCVEVIFLCFHLRIILFCVQPDWMNFSLLHVSFCGDHGGTVVKVLCYKSEGRWLHSRWCHRNFSLT